FTNAATGIITALPGATQQIRGSTFTNSGTINVSGGTVNVAPTNWTNPGTINVNSGTLNLNSPFTAAYLTPTTNYTRTAGSTVNMNGTYTNTGATLDVGSAGLFGAGGLSSFSGAIVGGTITSTDASPVLNSNNATLNGVTIGSNLTMNGNYSITNGITLANGVTVSQGGTYNQWSFNSPGVNHIATTGTATLNSNWGVFYIGLSACCAGGDTLQIDSGVTLQGYGSFNNYWGPNNVINAGTIISNANTGVFYFDTTNFTNAATGIITALPGATQQIRGSTFTNSGTINVSGGTVNVAPTTFTQSGIINASTGATFNRAAGFTNTGTLSGSGTIVVGTGAAKLVNQGTINPGGTGATGTLAISGDVQLSTGSNLNIELGGTTAGLYDKLAVTGSITNTAGALNASLLGGYTPTNADAISFMTMGGTASGTFTTTSLPAGFSAGYNLAAGEAARLIYATPGLRTFTNASGGLTWETAGNWVGSVLPGSSETALISAGYAVTHGSGIDSIAALTINSGNSLNVSGGSLTVSGITTLGGGLTVSGTGSAALNGALNGATSGLVSVSAGSLSLGAASYLNTLNLSGGTLSSPAGLTVNDYTQTAGTLNIGGTTLLKSIGSMSVNGAIAGNVGGTLTLQAVNNILLGTGGSITGTVAPLNVILNSDSDGLNGGAILLAAGTSISSNGGNITLGGGSGAISAGVGFARGYNAAGYYNGVAVRGNLTAAGGNIVINGIADPVTNGAGNWSDPGIGVEVSGNGTASTTGAGTITLTGQSMNAAPSTQNVWGVSVGSVSYGAGTVTSVNGAILINGTSGQAFNSVGAIVYNGSTVQATGTGSVTLNGTAGNGVAAANGTRGVVVERNSVVSTNSGLLTLNGVNTSTGLGVGTIAYGVNINGILGTADTIVGSTSGAINIIGQAVAGVGKGVVVDTPVIASKIGNGTTGNILLRSLNGTGMTLDAAAINTTGNVTLDAVGGGAITQTNGSITAVGLRVLGDTSATASLTSTANHVTTLAGNLTGATATMSYADSGSFNIGSLTTDDIGLGATTTTTGLTTTGAITLVTPGNITLNAGGIINAGTANVTLASTAGNFINNSGSATPIVATNTRIYSVGPATNVKGGMVPNASLFGCTYAGGCGAQVIPTTGTDFLYSQATAPTLSIVANALSKVYGAADPALTYIASGLVGGDTNASVLSGALTRAAGANVGNYAITQGTVAAAAGYGYIVSYTGANLGITPAPLTAALIGAPSKVYNGTTTAALAAANYALTGFIAGEGATVGQTVGTYNSKDVATANSVSATLAAANYTATGATLLSNYILPVTASGAGSITPATLTAAITGAPTKVYDGTTAATLAASNYSLSGFVAGEGASIGQTAGTYNSKDVATATTINATLAANNFTGTGSTLLANYLLPTTASGAGSITPAGLTVTANALSKTVGAVDPLLTYMTAGLQAPDTTTSTLSGALARLAGETAGLYAINQGTLVSLSTNYTMSYVPADFGIVAAPVVVAPVVVAPAPVAVTLAPVMNTLVNSIIVVPPSVPFNPPTPPVITQAPVAAPVAPAVSPPIDATGAAPIPPVNTASAAGTPADTPPADAQTVIVANAAVPVATPVAAAPLPVCK
ncbi:MAG: MBG domain-containing protein, partial [Gallionella sp.]|nr:MBG domain-containing protein [Gallionella sp.]